ncbi:hypothetical protein GN156_10045 [bacterium LRH843]|nr:hypothetical protein [bacterium LRH843]
MDGIFIYWFGWMFWIVVSFFWPQSKKRIWTSMILLVLLSLLPFNLSIASSTIPVAYLLLSLYLCWRIRLHHAKKITYMLLFSLMIGAAYGGFQLILIFDPVIAFIDERWMSACLVVAISFVLARTFDVRFYLALFGLIQGDFLTGLVMRDLFFSYSEIGSLAFFDKIAIVSFFFGAIWSMMNLSSWIQRLLNKGRSSELQQIS